MSSGRGAREVLAARVRALPRGTQKRVAELAGLRAETITRWKKGRGNPKLSELEAFAAAMDVSIRWLVTTDGPEESPKLPPTSLEERKIERLLREAERVQRELPSAVAALRSKR